MADALTLLRLLAVPLFVLAVREGAHGLAASIFALAAATDFADGRVARARGQTSDRGAFFDHAVDAVFVSAGAAALASVGALPWPLAPLIAFAFLQYALDSKLMRSRGLRASALGRWNGIAYYVIVAVPVVRDALGLGWPGPSLVRALGWALVVSTLLSISDRLRLLARARGSSGAGRAARSPR
ncbi:MAG TPA: CDP-alcohol phosphatidyltransferase family protein [Myxococcota bacterium]|jgi:phosphatidylglycerophosphate synthase